LGERYLKNDGKDDVLCLNAYAYAGPHDDDYAICLSYV
jgi:hypothetical protein